MVLLLDKAGLVWCGKGALLCRQCLLHLPAASARAHRALCGSLEARRMTSSLTVVLYISMLARYLAKIEVPRQKWNTATCARKLVLPPVRVVAARSGAARTRHEAETVKDADTLWAVWFQPCSPARIASVRDVDVLSKPPHAWSSSHPDSHRTTAGPCL